jgi:hypothetical protein
MPKPMTRRSALPYVFAAVSIPAVAVVAAPSAAALRDDETTTPHGYGRCSACACPGYVGNQNVCQNCGHNYATHW